MKGNLYWADREGNPPHAHCTFHFRPFDSGIDFSFSPEYVALPPPCSFKVLKKTYFPSYKVWKSGVQKALDCIRRKELEKVVLSRICVLELASPPDPFAIAAALKQKAQGAFVFCMQTHSESFLGASPERLFIRKDRKLISEAIAGTRPRGKTLVQDERLRKALLESAKDLREFSPVQTYLQSALSPLCVNPLSFTPISVHQTQNVQHLYSRCSGTLKKAVTDEEILSSLHPTPALCGMPTKKAYSLIQELEPFDRGLFGGAIGWTTPESSEWIVGIRSCLIKGNTATLFSGTGIVEGSDPEEEWEELNQKIKLYDRILDH